MVEHRRFGNLLPHLILLIGVVIVAFPVYLAVIAAFGAVRSPLAADIPGGLGSLAGGGSAARHVGLLTRGWTLRGR